jgi:PAS domain S-box-containing protein/putative nucleotidyltransferase with HDIG domain
MTEEGSVALRVLFVEDSADDTELMLRRLRDGGFAPQWARVQTAAALREALTSERWDVALIDYNLPGFSGPDALGLARHADPDLPCITVSGTIDEDTAVATITAGTVDYILKHNFTRLAPAVRRAVDGAELRRAHRHAAENARLALYAVDHASLSIMMIAPEGTVTYVNDFGCRLLCICREDLVGTKIWEHLPTPSEEQWAGTWDQAKRRGAVEFELDYLNPAEERVVLDVAANYLPDADCLIGYGRDITARREAEEMARASESRYRRIVETTNEGFFMGDRDYNVVFANPRFAEMLGYSDPREIAGRPTADFLFDSDQEAHAAQVDARKRGASARYERRLRRKDGEEIWTIISSTPLFDGNGEFEGAFAMFTDITDIRRAEQALRASDERFEQFAHHFPGYLFMQDEQLRYIYINRQEVPEGHVPRDEWIGKTPSEVWGTEEARESEKLATRALGGEVIDIIEPWSTSHQPEYLHSLYFPMPQGDGPPIVGGLSIDVTGQHEAQDEVRRTAERLRRTVEGAVLAMSNVVETRDPYTAGHERRVSELATAMAVELGLQADELDGLRLAGLIHDIGKIAVPAEILAKPGRLSDIEFNLIKQHSQAGYDILAAIEFSRPVAEMVLQHHERLDGSGYPRGLKAADILPEAKILAVADVVEAMSSHRPYRAAMGMEAALDEIRQNAGVKYDAEIAAACLRVVREQGFQFTP